MKSTDDLVEEYLSKANPSLPMKGSDDENDGPSEDAGAELAGPGDEAAKAKGGQITKLPPPSVHESSANLHAALSKISHLGEKGFRSLHPGTQKELLDAGMIDASGYLTAQGHQEVSQYFAQHASNPKLGPEAQQHAATRQQAHAEAAGQGEGAYEHWKQKQVEMKGGQPQPGAQPGMQPGMPPKPPMAGPEQAPGAQLEGNKPPMPPQPGMPPQGAPNAAQMQGAMGKPGMPGAKPPMGHGAPVSASAPNQAPENVPPNEGAPTARGMVGKPPMQPGKPAQGVVPPHEPQLAKPGMPAQAMPPAGQPGVPPKKPVPPQFQKSMRGLDELGDYLEKGQGGAYSGKGTRTGTPGYYKYTYPEDVRGGGNANHQEHAEAHGKAAHAAYIEHNNLSIAGKGKEDPERQLASAKAQYHSAMQDAHMGAHAQLHADTIGEKEKHEAFVTKRVADAKGHQADMEVVKDRLDTQKRHAEMAAKQEAPKFEIRDFLPDDITKPVNVSHLMGQSGQSKEHVTQALTEMGYKINEKGVAQKPKFGEKPTGEKKAASTVKIHVSGTEPKEMPIKHKVGNLAVHQNVNGPGYHVTHIPSGKMITHEKHLKDAKAVANHLHSTVPNAMDDLKFGEYPKAGHNHIVRKMSEALGAWKRGEVKATSAESEKPVSEKETPTSGKYTNHPDVQKYIRTIRNPAKKAYAQAYAKWKDSGEQGAEPEHGSLSVMGAQAVRLHLGNVVAPRQKMEGISGFQTPVKETTEPTNKQRMDAHYASAEKEEKKNTIADSQKADWHRAQAQKLMGPLAGQHGETEPTHPKASPEIERHHQDPGQMFGKLAADLKAEKEKQTKFLESQGLTWKQAAKLDEPAKMRLQNKYQALKHPQKENETETAAYVREQKERTGTFSVHTRTAHDKEGTEPTKGSGSMHGFTSHAEAKKYADDFQARHPQGKTAIEEHGKPAKPVQGDLFAKKSMSGISELGDYLRKSAEQIPGGLSSGKSPSDFDPKALAQGTKVEMEHTTSKKVAQEICMDHLTEDPSYYTKLAKMEKCIMQKSGTGEGSRGGHITGHTTSGKPIYASSGTLDHASYVKRLAAARSRQHAHAMASESHSLWSPPVKRPPGETDTDIAEEWEHRIHERMPHKDRINYEGLRPAGVLLGYPEQASEMAAKYAKTETDKSLEKSMDTEINAFLQRNPHPDDTQVHALAGKLGVEVDDLEERIYAMAGKAKRMEKCIMQKSGTGEGSRGGHVTGHTSGGKPIYETPHKTIGGADMPGWSTIKYRVKHPTKPGYSGALIQHNQTQKYALELGGTINSVPQDWARKEHMGKSMSGLIGLGDYLEKSAGKAADGMPDQNDWDDIDKPTETTLGGSANGGDLTETPTPEGAGKSGAGEGQDAKGQLTGVSQGEQEILGDDRDPAKQMTPGTSAIEDEIPEGYKSLTPASQREMVAKQTAQHIAKLQKSNDVRVGAPHPLSMASIHGNTDAECESLLKSDFYHGASPTLALPGSVLRQNVLCKSEGCGCRYSAMLTACPGCGEGTVMNRMLPRSAYMGGGSAIQLEKSACDPILKPAPVEDDVCITGPSPVVFRKR